MIDDDCLYNCIISLTVNIKDVFASFANKPFYSCVLSYLAMNESKAGGDLALIETSLLFSYK